MFKITIVVLLMCIGTACTPKIKPLETNAAPFQIELAGGQSGLFDKVLDKSASLGASVRLIDRQTGFISLISPQAELTYLDKGKPVNARAWAICEKIYNPASLRSYNARTGAVEWNILLKEKEGKTVVTINLVSVTTTSVYQAGFNNPIAREYKPKSVSTHVFEQLIIEKLQ